MRPELLEKITGNKNLRKVSLANAKINDDEILEIIEIIKQVKPTASVIDLDSNELTDKGAQILSEQLILFDKITEISIQFNNVGRDGALKLFSLKKGFPDLDILFHGNKISNVREMDEIEQLALMEFPKP